MDNQEYKHSPWPPIFESPPLIMEPGITSIHNISFLVLLLGNIAWTCFFAIRHGCFTSPSGGLFTLIRLLLLCAIWLSPYDIHDRIFYLLCTFFIFIVLDTWDLCASWVPSSYVTTTTTTTTRNKRKRGPYSIPEVDGEYDGDGEWEIPAATGAFQWQYIRPLLKREDYDDPNVKALHLDLRPRTARLKPLPDSSGIFAGKKQPYEV